MENSLEKCDKCDERGYLPFGEYSRKSCECGWAIDQMRMMFDKVPIEELLAYGKKRVAEKSKVQ